MKMKKKKSQSHWRVSFSSVRYTGAASSSWASWKTLSLSLTQGWFPKVDFLHLQIWHFCFSVLKKKEKRKERTNHPFSFHPRGLLNVLFSTHQEKKEFGGKKNWMRTNFWESRKVHSEKRLVLMSEAGKKMNGLAVHFKCCLRVHWGGCSKSQYFSLRLGFYTVFCVLSFSYFSQWKKIIIEVFFNGMEWLRKIDCFSRALE